MSVKPIRKILYQNNVTKIKSARGVFDSGIGENQSPINAFEVPPADAGYDFLGLNAGNLIASGTQNNILNSRRSSVVCGRNNQIGRNASSAYYRFNGQYNSHTIGLGQDQQSQEQSNHINDIEYSRPFNNWGSVIFPSRSNILEIKCTNGMQVKKIEISDDYRCFINGGSSMQLALRTNIMRVGSDISAYLLSDLRLKKSQKPIQDCLNKIKKMSAVRYEWINESQEGQKKDIGLIAQEVQSIVPEIVSQRADGFLAIKYAKIIPILVETIKQKQQKINKLKSVIDSYGNTN
jgi:hypothetical protein